jgi:hypothetical protein
VGSGFAQNFGFGLAPVCDVLAFDGSAALVKFGGAPADGLLHLGRILA